MEAKQRRTMARRIPSSGCNQGATAFTRGPTTHCIQRVNDRPKPSHSQNRPAGPNPQSEAAPCGFLGTGGGGRGDEDWGGGDGKGLRKPDSGCSRARNPRNGTCSERAPGESFLWGEFHDASLGHVLRFDGLCFFDRVLQLARALSRHARDQYGARSAAARD